MHNAGDLEGLEQFPYIGRIARARDDVDKGELFQLFQIGPPGLFGRCRFPVVPGLFPQLGTTHEHRWHLMLQQLLGEPVPPLPAVPGRFIRLPWGDPAGDRFAREWDDRPAINKEHAHAN